nr:hypothetical protein GCM10020093_065430 [Planobispora longispora]
MRVLVVEDEEELADAIARGLRLHAIAVDVAYDGREALEMAAYTPYDVVVLDRDLPEVHGDDVCRELRAGSAGGRVLMLTAAGQVRDRVDGLSSARTTTWSSRSRSPSWWPGSGRSPAARRGRRRPRWSGPG